MHDAVRKRVKSSPKIETLVKSSRVKLSPSQIVPVGTPPPVFPCDICGRSFIEQTLQRHIKICEKNAVKQRKPFDSFKQRAAGTDIKTAPKADPKKLEKAKRATANWRNKHEELVSTLRAARGVTHAMKTGAPLPPPPSQSKVNPDYVQCPTCQRNFNESAAERHIPWCKEKNKRIGTTSNKTAAEKEKMAIRTQYKPPLPGSKKRQIVPPKAGPALRTGRTGSGSNMQHLEDQYSNMSVNEKTSSGRGRTKPGGYGTVNGSKARSASLERRLEKSSDNYRSSSGDSVRGKRYTDDEDEYDYNGYGDAADRYGRRKAGSNHILPHQRVKAAKVQRSTNSRTPTPPSKYSSGSIQRKPSLENVNGRRASKFCHECGTQYPVAQAKFCCECGTRRAFLD
ncbi:zinc finger C2HC domain-containing protein 1A-like isoform X2 [Acanthaster planci]|uniref:Zinc finger C2HC domain-containing protein 1A-like isoform X2 n=1 Tax=Acanthaster planci TaxID=133434 RepID=A0A8B7ZI39_ACAPL|nr:zinc finger C2HC domain-containing protein 1A-like isoform X2 [Acanthaster planci]